MNLKSKITCLSILLCLSPMMLINNANASKTLSINAEILSKSKDDIALTFLTQLSRLNSWDLYIYKNQKGLSNELSPDLKNSETVLHLIEAKMRQLSFRKTAEVSSPEDFDNVVKIGLYHFLALYPNEIIIDASNLLDEYVNEYVNNDINGKTIDLIFKSLNNENICTTNFKSLRKNFDTKKFNDIGLFYALNHIQNSNNSSFDANFFWDKLQSYPEIFKTLIGNTCIPLLHKLKQDFIYIQQFQMKQLKNSAISRENEIVSLNQKIIDLTTKNKSSLTLNEQLIGKLNAYKKEINDLNYKINALKCKSSKSEEYEQMAYKYKSDFEQAQMQIKKLQFECENLKEVVDEQEAHIGNYKKTIEDKSRIIKTFVSSESESENELTPPPPSEQALDYEYKFCRSFNMPIPFNHVNRFLQEYDFKGDQEEITKSVIKACSSASNFTKDSDTKYKGVPVYHKTVPCKSLKKDVSIFAVPKHYIQEADQVEASDLSLIAIGTHIDNNNVMNQYEVIAKAVPEISGLIKLSQELTDK